MRITVKHQLTLSEQEECLGFVVDTARDSTSEGKHRSELDSGSATQRETVFSQKTCSAEDHTQLATHGLPAVRAPVYRGCPCRDPLGCPPIPRQDGIGDKAPTLWLLLLCTKLRLS